MEFGMLHLFGNPIGKTEHQIVKERGAVSRETERGRGTAEWRPCP